ncbi:MAG: hypothetical protein A2694_02425 [Candidatus Blackburnbacteria bacterium RIFCSPHIGHO2_01_FULL_40_17]|uniref:Uncharacterized protein n=1 Tax=Candidatus Blackburnbacteria bacterium RIFCSPLOWO2_01_FULL_40_20 TaxID=1797519 RepID=A0A1G1VEV8_9BACT|nr:MAG: hypothetical protein A2694_02425 [Candidatus Blackburnbacteria bacterium RIFCSPHIGHO2_01_FULL_40_17]OGY13742.1 MAG: hypothetical protein A3A77_01780 [Candidatus Blackburnbacteria bacterium RIFCSPLOWO2_01_FULL_40_20]
MVIDSVSSGVIIIFNFMKSFSLLQLTFLLGLFLLPFIFWPWALVPYELPRVWFFQRWVEILVIIGVLTGLTKIQTRKLNPLFIFICIFISISVSVSILGVDFPKSFWGNYYRADGLITLFHLAGLFLFLYLFWNSSWQKPTVLSISLGSIGVSLLAIISLLIPGVFKLPPSDAWNGAIGATFGQPKFLAGYLTVTLPFIYFLATKQVNQRKLWIAALIFQVIAIFLTFSKGGIAGIGLFILGSLLLKQKIINPLIPLISLIFITVVGGIFYFSTLITNPTILGTAEYAAGFNPESRPRIFIKGFFGYLKRPLFGWGWSNFDYAASSIVWPTKIEKDVYIDKAHSSILEVLVTTGPLGLIFYIAILIAALVGINKSNEENVWKNTLLLSLVLYLLHSQTNVTSVAQDVVLWLILGIAVSTSQVVVKSSSSLCHPERSEETLAHASNPSEINSEILRGVYTEFDERAQNDSYQTYTNKKMKPTLVILLIIIFSLTTGGIGWWVGKNGNFLQNNELISPLLKQSFPTSPKEKPLDKYSYENLSKREFAGSEIKIEQTLKSTPGFTSYLFSYQSDGKKVTGQMNIPNITTSTMYRSGAWPTILMIRGYADPKAYKTGDGTKNAAAFFAKNGFLTIAPDFLGYGGSDQNAGDILESRFQTYTTVLNLLASLQSVKQIDQNNLFIWAHSNGGHIALATLEITGRNIPTTLWAPVSKYFPYSVLAYTDDSDDKGKLIRRVLGEFEQNYDPNNYSVDTYFDRINSPLQLHQGTLDDLVLKRWSDELVAALKSKDKKVNYFVYPRADHNMMPNWNIAVERDLEFFRKNLNLEEPNSR